MNKDQAIEAGFTHEVVVSGVPDGARSEDYIGGPRYYICWDHAEHARNKADMAMMNHPKNFEPEMEFSVEALAAR